MRSFMIGQSCSTRDNGFLFVTVKILNSYGDFMISGKRNNMMRKDMKDFVIKTNIQGDNV